MLSNTNNISIFFVDLLYQIIEIMKRVIMLSAMFLLVNCTYSQYSNYNPPKHGWLSVELGGSVGVLSGTFVVVDHRINNDIGTPRQTATIAAIGMITSAGMHLGSRYIRENDIKINLKRYKYDIKKFFNFKF